MDGGAEFGSRLGFTPAWYSLGVVDQAFLERARAEWDKGEDANTEHYRWWAFREFVAARRPLSPDLAAALYELGAADADAGMGGSMMSAIVYLPECPQAVLDAAAASGARHLVRAVERRRG
ncbi:MAG: hypothetical protein L0Z62_11170 [Gemmataceae bacterium]|nr:hypothetical protein [Gemmataceae bacterium]